MPKDGDLRIWWGPFRPSPDLAGPHPAFRVPVESQEEGAVVLAILSAYDQSQGRCTNGGGIETYVPGDGWCHSCEQDDYDEGNLPLETKLRIAQIQQEAPAVEPPSVAAS